MGNDSKQLARGRNSAPRKPCRKCGKLSNGTYCDVHTHEKKEEVKQRDKWRGTAHERGYTSRWTKVSKLYRKENPLCVHCEAKGIIKLNNCVDHIIPVSGPDDPLFWEESNWQGLCTPCHSIKTSSEDGGFGNKEKEKFDGRIG